MPETSVADLFTPVALGDLSLPNRVVMAPMTRNRADDQDAPHDLNVEYYRQRASAGLIITEGSQVSPQGKGYPRTPGIYSAGQVAGWRRVTDAVHRAGGRIFLQLWHVGRASHPSLQPGNALPVAPSAIAPEGETFTGEGMHPFVTPRALATEEIPDAVAQFRHGAEQARRAGFDGVELHGANGYLIDQFLRDGSNRRSDAYGGTVENRARFLREVVEATVDVWGAGRVGVRLSPTGSFNSMSDSDPAATFGHAAGLLGRYGLAYLHVVEDASGFDWAALKRRFGGPYIANGGYDH
ncbi:MAG: alkene reductase, partial [Rhodanobacter sp.]